MHPGAASSWQHGERDPGVGGRRDDARGVFAVLGRGAEDTGIFFSTLILPCIAISSSFQQILGKMADGIFLRFLLTPSCRNPHKQQQWVLPVGYR